MLAVKKTHVYKLIFAATGQLY